ncbi:hypothetical protein RISK_001106 [Rhodopirellula islandica]|uniref:Uncharacterized protein n=1 Tax=Rhodopirellula islandica TaxID=595434 RepID=A0A0J1BJV0_RHOIS|nr:hypothetical protein RISK_001106 [Rhodopirellula islandica]
MRNGHTDRALIDFLTDTASAIGNQAWCAIGHTFYGGWERMRGSSPLVWPLSPGPGIKIAELEKRWGKRQSDLECLSIELHGSDDDS